ncbi:MAG: hypothetical protein ABF904_09995 [Ethanoligenens sp.]
MSGTYIPPVQQSVTEFLKDFVSTHGEKRWGISMYDGCTALIGNYIDPVIGDMHI